MYDERVTHTTLIDGRERAELRAEVNAQPMFRGHITRVSITAIPQRRAVSSAVNRNWEARKAQARLEVSAAPCPYVRSYPA